MGPLSAPVPVLVLTGFLGAGKTSLLNSLLTESVGRRVAAVVNDFGEIDVDARLVAGRVDSVVSLAGGCLCCEVDASEVTETLEALASADDPVDLVVVEASGLAEPDVLGSMVAAAAGELVSYAGTVQVVDAVAFPETLGRHPRLGRHVAGADLVVVNKCDLVSREDLESVRALVRDHAPRVPVVAAVRGRVPVDLLAELAPRPVDAGDQVPLAGAAGHRHDGHPHDHLHDGYATAVADPGGELHPRRFLAAISRPPEGTFRAKGALTLRDADGPRRFLVQLVGRRLELEALGPDDDRPDGLVLIGVGLSDFAARFLDEAVLAPGEAVDAEAMFGVFPYLRGPADAADVAEWIYDDERASPLTGEATMLSDPEDPDSADPAFTP